MFGLALSRYPLSNLKTLPISNAVRSFVLVISVISAEGEDYGRASVSSAARKAPTREAQTGSVRSVLKALSGANRMSLKSAKPLERPECL
jgi:hypothetical protein